MPADIANRDQIKAAVVDAILAGAYLSEIAEQPGMPAETTLHEWKAADEDFRSRCAQARARAAERHEQRVRDYALKVAAGEMDHKAGWAAANMEMWLAKVRAPEVYSEKLAVQHSGRVSVVPVLNINLAGIVPPAIDVSPMKGGDHHGGKEIEGEGR